MEEFEGLKVPEYRFANLRPIDFCQCVEMKGKIPSCQGLDCKECLFSPISGEAFDRWYAIHYKENQKNN